jgi:hypothetical protein
MSPPAARRLSTDTERAQALASQGDPSTLRDRVFSSVDRVEMGKLRQGLLPVGLAEELVSSTLSGMRM